MPSSYNGRPITATAHLPIPFSTMSFPIPTFCVWATTTIWLEPPCTQCQVLLSFIQRIWLTGRTSHIALTASTSTTMPSPLRITRRYTVKVSGHLPSVMPTDSSMCSPTSMARAYNAIHQEISAAHGNIIICKDAYTICQFSSTTMVRYMPFMDMGK